MASLVSPHIYCNTSARRRQAISWAHILWSRLVLCFVLTFWWNRLGLGLHRWWVVLVRSARRGRRDYILCFHVCDNRLRHWMMDLRLVHWVWSHCIMRCISRLTMMSFRRSVRRHGAFADKALLLFATCSLELQIPGSKKRSYARCSGRRAWRWEVRWLSVWYRKSSSFWLCDVGRCCYLWHNLILEYCKRWEYETVSICKHG